MTDSGIELRRGQIYWVDWSPGRGSEQIGRRPALIVQADPINRSTRYTNTVVVAISTALHPVPTHVEIEPTEENGLTQKSYVLCEQIITITRVRLEDKIGVLDRDSLDMVDRALKRVLAL